MKLSELMGEYKAMPKEKKLWCWGCVGLLLLTFMYAAGWIAGGFKSSNPFYCWCKMLTTGVGWSIFGIFFLLLLIGIIVLLRTRNATNKIIATDDRGLEYLQKGTNGTSRFLTKNEIGDVYNVDTIETSDQFLYGQIDTEGKQVVTFKDNEYGSGNMALLVIGASGTGKTYSIIGPNILQAARRGDSIIVTDPKGDLWKKYAGYLESLGYNTKLFNLVQARHSSAWNCVKETVDPLTGQFDTERATDFCDVFMRNTNIDINRIGDEFWYTSALNLLVAMIALCAYKHDEELREVYRRELSSVLKSNGFSMDDIRSVCERAINTATIRQMESTILKLYKRLGISEEETRERFTQIEYDLENQYTIAQVYYTLLTVNSLASLKALFEDLPGDSMAKITFLTFDRDDVKENVKASAVQGLLNRMRFLSEESTRQMLSNDGIDLGLPGTEKCAFFCMISDKSNSKKVVSSLFFNFLFKDVMDGFDNDTPEGQTKRKSVFVFMDEFFSIGAVPGMERYLSTCRSRKIAPAMVLQDVTKIYTLYGESEGKGIMSAPDTCVFLGSGALDTETPTLISLVSGVATVRENMVSRDAVAGRTRVTNFDVDSVREREAKRNVLNMDEVAKMKEGELLLIRRGQNIAKINRFGLALHPDFQKLTYRSVEDVCLPGGGSAMDRDPFIKERLNISAKPVYNDGKSLDEFVDGLITDEDKASEGKPTVSEMESVEIVGSVSMPDDPDDFFGPNDVVVEEMGSDAGYEPAIAPLEGSVKQSRDTRKTTPQGRTELLSADSDKENDAPARRAGRKEKKSALGD